MTIGQLKDQIEDVRLANNLTDDDEVVLDTEDGIYGIAGMLCESGRLIILAGDPEDEG